MASEETPFPAASDGGDPPEKNRKRSSGAMRFVAVFAVVVLSLLAGYRYAINTAASDWYLFQVARHTNWVLDWIGYRSDLEKSTGANLDPAEVRAVLRGKAPRQTPPGGTVDPDSGNPLTAWEKWRYRARQARQDPDNTRIIGPQVQFVLKPGHPHRIEALEADLRAIQGAPSGSVGLGIRARQLDAEIQELREELTAGLRDPDTRRAQQGRFFSFIVIPECGAIEVMAIFLAAVIAFPASWGARIWGLAAGLPVMYGVNILRLSCLAYIGAVDTSGKWFEFCHEYVWQAVYVVFVVVVWMAWVEFRVRRAAG